MLKSNIKAFIFMLTTFVLLVGTIFAWSTISDTTNMEFIELNVGSSVVETYLYIQKNDGEEIQVSTPEDISNVLNLGIPSDGYHFRLRIQNNTTTVKTVNIKFQNMTSHGLLPEADIRDVYLLTDSKVNFNGTDIPITPLVSEADDPLVGYQGQVLQHNRFKNYLDDSNDMVLLENGKIEPGEVVDFRFHVTFDFNISNSSYRGYIMVEKLYVNIA
jgi:hypothetical protein